MMRSFVIFLLVLVIGLSASKGCLIKEECPASLESLERCQVYNNGQLVLYSSGNNQDYNTSFNACKVNGSAFIPETKEELEAFKAFAFSNYKFSPSYFAVWFPLQYVHAREKYVWIDGKDRNDLMGVSDATSERTFGPPGFCIYVVKREDEDSMFKYDCANGEGRSAIYVYR